VGTDRIAKQALKYRPKGKRSIGRPRKRWKVQIIISSLSSQIHRILLWVLNMTERERDTVGFTEIKV
jgi:hypothetical protein